ncbi:M43 family zinc metalloprotease [uncultured Alistipes sp.]|uniref:M43 family zinc metalloprotease n=1 Tax=uncultured Alistipes sp. TaxID=538949 RepID=UPI00259B875B|nr:M43 family zinc metalloprotease [uncultured Alistipes sp.]
MKIGYSILALALLAVSCTKDAPVPEQPASSFRIRIEGFESGLFQTDNERYPYHHFPQMVLERLPEGERVLRLGGVYSHRSASPDTTDYNFMDDYTRDEILTQWDGCSPLKVPTAPVLQLLPGRTYRFTGMVETDRGTYRSNTVEIRSEKSAPVVVSPDAYRIPVVFHLFADDRGRYPKADFLYDMLEYANMVYGNYYGLPHLCDAKVCFVPAERDLDGRLLEQPGIRYEREKVYVDADAEQVSREFDPDIHLWDVEQVLNVWVCPFRGEEVDVIGFSWFPMFDEAHMLPGCTAYDPKVICGVFLDGSALDAAGNLQSFAHEAGHFLGLGHVFKEDWCADTPCYDLESYLSVMYELRYEWEYADAPGRYFLSDNLMDYFFSYQCGVTPAQAGRIRHTLRYAYNIPGEAGITAPSLRSARAMRFPPNPVW